MVRIIALAACVFILSLGGTAGQEAERAEREAAASNSTAAGSGQRRHGLESIADEAAEFADDGSGADGMTRATDELMDSEELDGCTASIDSAAC